MEFSTRGVSINLTQEDIDNRNPDFSIRIKKVIPLEMREESVFQMIDKIKFKNDSIFIFDAFGTRKIFVFDKSGQFITTIGSKGKGPGEYNLPNDFHVNDDGSVMVLASIRNKLIKYSVSGKFLEEQDVFDEVKHFTISSDQKILTINDPRTDFQFYQISNGVKEKSMIPSSDVIKEKIKLTSIAQEKGFFLCADEYYFNPYFSKTIYKADVAGVIKECYNIDIAGANYWFFDPEKDNHSSSKGNDRIEAFDYYITKNHLLLKFQVSPEIRLRWALIDRNDSSLVDAGFLYFSSPYDKTFLTRMLVTNTIGSTNEGFVTRTTALGMKYWSDYLKNAPENEKKLLLDDIKGLSNTINNYDENGNDCIIIYDFPS